MLKATETATYTCTKRCYYLNKFFEEGEAFPENWLKNGFEPGKHFAPTAEAAEIIRIGKLQNQAMTAGDDPRSNDELKAILAKAGIEVAGTWTRTQLWAAAKEHENRAPKPTTERKEE